jgi:hypothetical protein
LRLAWATQEDPVSKKQNKKTPKTMSHVDIIFLYVYICIDVYNWNKSYTYCVFCTASF